MDEFIVGLQLDLQKMPLGKLSKKQIQQAYSVLSDLQELVKSGGPDNRFVGASNRFYTLVPHDFGVENPPVLNSEEMIKVSKMCGPFSLCETLKDTVNFP
jgi:poly [ADP-ribose] polymerase